MVERGHDVGLTIRPLHTGVANSHKLLHAEPCNNGSHCSVPFTIPSPQYSTIISSQSTLFVHDTA
jgi:hypothetical protein